MSNRILDMSCVDKLSSLVSVAKELGMFISIDFMGDIWILQMFDAKERLVVSANAKSANEAVGRLYTNWFSKTAPKV